MTAGQTNPHATRLRRDATDAERTLWNAVRARHLGGFKFRRQATIGSYIADFVCAGRRLVVEVDGGQHGGAEDIARDAAMMQMGYHVVRFTNREVLTNLEGVLEALLMLLEEEPPSPNPHRVNSAPRCLGHAGGMTDPMRPPAGEGFKSGASVS